MKLLYVLFFLHLKKKAFLICYPHLLSLLFNDTVA